MRDLAFHKIRINRVIAGCSFPCHPLIHFPVKGRLFDGHFGYSPFFFYSILTTLKIQVFEFIGIQYNYMKQTGLMLCCTNLSNNKHVLTPHYVFCYTFTKMGLKGDNLFDRSALQHQGSATGICCQICLIEDGHCSLQRVRSTK